MKLNKEEYLPIELLQFNGKGYYERSFREFRQFFLAFSELLTNEHSNSVQSEENIQRTLFAISVNVNWRTLFAILHWSHFEELIRVENENIFSKKYFAFLLSEEKLEAEIERQKIITKYQLGS